MDENNNGISKELLQKLDRVLNEVNDAIDNLDPDSKEAETMFSPVQDLGWAVDELLGRHGQQ